MKKLIIGFIAITSIAANASTLPQECKNTAAKSAYLEQRKCRVGECEIAHVFGLSARALYNKMEEDGVSLGPDRYAQYPYNTQSFVIKSHGERLQCFQALFDTCSIYECELWLHK